MILDCPNAEALSQVATDEGWSRVAGFEFTEASLAGVVELGRTAFHGGRDARMCALRCMEKAPVVKQLLETTLAMLDGAFDRVRPQAHLFSAPELELWLVRGEACIESKEFSLFVQRFQRSLTQAGFGERFPYGLSQALIEMTANVVHHGVADGTPPAAGLVGFHVVQNAMNYVVADLGRGVLAGLQENPKWKHLDAEADALVAAAKDGATRLPQHTGGDGFRLAFQAFVDREGVLSMRSGDGLARIHGNMNGREAEMGNAANVPGLRVAAMCSLTGAGKELQIRT